MRPFHAALGLALGLLPLTAAEPTYGIGLSLKQNEQTIYLPVQLSPSLRLEGSLQFRTLFLKDSLQETTDRQTAVGVGLFHVRSLGEGFQLYAGPRVTYGKASEDRSQQFDTSSRSYGVTPLVGLEYRLTPHLILSGEAGLSWTRTDSEFSTKSPQSHSSDSEKRWNTHSAIALRYWF